MIVKDFIQFGSFQYSIPVFHSRVPFHHSIPLIVQPSIPGLAKGCHWEHIT